MMDRKAWLPPPPPRECLHQHPIAALVVFSSSWWESLTPKESGAFLFTLVPTGLSWRGELHSPSCDLISVTGTQKRAEARLAVVPCARPTQNKAFNGLQWWRPEWWHYYSDKPMNRKRIQMVWQPKRCSFQVSSCSSLLLLPYVIKQKKRIKVNKTKRTIVKHCRYQLSSTLDLCTLEYRKCTVSITLRREVLFTSSCCCSGNWKRRGINRFWENWALWR